MSYNDAPVTVSAMRAVTFLALSTFMTVTLPGCAFITRLRGSYESHPEHLTSGALLELDTIAISPRADVLRAIYSRGLTLTKVSEGWVPHLYNDSAKYCTIGYGHLVKKSPCDGSEPVEFRAGLTRVKGEELLVVDMATAQLTVMNTVTVDLSDGQFAALCDFVFNVGSANFRQSTLLQVVNLRQDNRVAAQFRRWVLAGGKPWPGLRARREGEITLYFDGVPQPRVGPPADEDLSPIDVRLGERPQ